MIEVELTLPSIVADGPDKARAICQARLTKSQVIVESGEIVDQRMKGRINLVLPMRFNRKTLRPIPYRRNTWQLSKISAASSAAT